MKSMTGYAFRERADGNYQLSVEMKSWNNRYLDLSVSLPPYLSPLEGEVKSALQDAVRRGKVEVTLRYRELEEDIAVHLDRKAVAAYRDIFRECCREAGIAEDIHLGHFLHMEGVLKTQKNRDIEAVWAVVKPLFDEALADFLASREREGLSTEADIMRQLAAVENGLETVRSYAGTLEEKIIRDLRDRFAQVLADGADEQRIYAETAVMLVRYSVNEEISRLDGHIRAFRDIAAKEEACGKKLDFLCQEFNREINTIGSKSTIMEVNQTVVNMKDALENIREQLRNVE